MVAAQKPPSSPRWVRFQPSQWVSLTPALTLEDSSKLPDPHVLAAEIADDLRSALEQIESVLGDLQQRAGPVDRQG